MIYYIDKKFSLKEQLMNCLYNRPFYRYRSYLSDTLNIKKKVKLRNWSRKEMKWKKNLLVTVFQHFSYRLYQCYKFSCRIFDRAAVKSRNDTRTFLSTSQIRLIIVIQELHDEDIDVLTTESAFKLSYINMKSSPIKPA